MIQAKNRIIKSVAVLGSGVMGSRLACHFANIGLKVILLDIPTPGYEGTESAKKSQMVNQMLQNALKSNPTPVYTAPTAKNIVTGNFEENLPLINQCDWILEAVIENLDIKKSLFEKVEQYRRPGTLITSNTSGIPIHNMLEGRSEDFRAHFCGTHFFNPPRYLRLLEIIPTPSTHPEVTNFFMHYGDLFLGKKTVLCKDTPAFIANRVGVFSIMAIFHLMKQMNMNIEEIDSVTGPVSGRPKSATFRTCDVVGIDTLAKVAMGVKENCAKDEQNAMFELPPYLLSMIEKKWLGDKSGQGFYKKSKDAEGNRTIDVLDLDTLEYRTQQKPRFESVGNARKEDNLKKRIKILAKGGDKASDFFNLLNQHVFSYVSFRIPEIADALYQIDDAMKAGFGWDLGPFETWDILGIERNLAVMEAKGIPSAPWVKEMLAKGFTSFYKTENGRRFHYNPATGDYQPIPGLENFILLENYNNEKPIWANKGATLHHIGDGVLNLEFHTKMNSIGSEILSGINASIDIAEKQGYKGLVLGNEAPNFSAGANLAMVFMLAIEQEYDELDLAIRYFQNTAMRLRYSGIPVVIAPHGLTLGGSCEMTLHADSSIAAAETYIGLVEFGVGVIPGGGGTKEFVVRTSDSFYPGDPQLPTLQQRFTTIAQAKVATSGYEAFEHGYLHHDKDRVVMNIERQIAEAKSRVIELSDNGYTQPAQREDILVLGRTALGALYAGIEAFEIGNYATAHDKKIARKLAFVMSGGDLSEPTRVSEQYLLDLEREAFLSLLGEKKTLERIQSILKTGKPLRN